MKSLEKNIHEVNLIFANIVTYLCWILSLCCTFRCSEEDLQLEVKTLTIKSHKLKTMSLKIANSNIDNIELIHSVYQYHINV